MEHSESRERVLTAAESLFVERGYNAVTVKDIAKAVGIHHASIYHHIPGGKAELYTEVMTRHMERHRVGIRDAMDAAGGALRAQLLAIANWLLANPPVDVIRLANSDLPSIPTLDAQTIGHLAYEATLIPISNALEAAQQRGEIDHPHIGNIAGAIFSAIEGLHAIPERYIVESRMAMAEEIIDVFIRGMRPSS